MSKLVSALDELNNMQLEKIIQVNISGQII